MHTLIVGGSGGMGSALVDCLKGDATTPRVAVWQRRAAGNGSALSGK